jgi:hypothetical protein
MLGLALAFLARVRMMSNGPCDARALAATRESLTLAHLTGSRYVSGHAFATWGDLLWAKDNWSSALGAWHTALRAFADLLDPRGIAGCLERLGLALARRGSPAEGAWLLGAADGLHATLGMQLRSADAVDHAHFAQYEEQLPVREAFPVEFSAGRSASAQQAVARAIEHSHGLEPA